METLNWNGIFQAILGIAFAGWGFAIHSFKTDVKESLKNLTDEFRELRKEVSHLATRVTVLEVKPKE